MNVTPADPDTSSSVRVPIAGGDTGKPRNLAKRLAHITRLIPAKARILDAGCGSGEYVDVLGRLGYRVCGVEYQTEKVAKWDLANPGDTRVTQGDIETLSFPDGAFDAVILNEVLEHVPNQEAVLREARRVLAQDGRLLVFSPNRRYPFETHGVHSKSGRHILPIQTFLLPYLPLPVTVRLVTPWARNYWPSELATLVANAGFRVVEQDYVWQTFENVGGRQGPVFRKLSPTLRRCASLLERVPLLRTMASSQLVVAAPI